MQSTSSKVWGTPLLLSGHIKVYSVNVSTLKTFVCHINGKPHFLSVNKAVYKLFQHYALQKGLQDKGSRFQLTSIMLLSAGSVSKAG